MANGTAQLKHPGGRPTAYKDEYALQAQDWCSRFPFTHKDLAMILGRDRATIFRWKKAHPEFSDCIVKGCDDYNNPLVEKSFTRRALGYDTIETVEERDGEGALIKTKKTKKHVPPDTGAAIFFLKNRLPGRWRDKIEIQTTGNINITWDDPTAIDVSPEQIEDVKELEGAKDTELSDK